MNPKYLHTLEFDKIRARLAAHSAFSASEELARDLMPAIESRRLAVPVDRSFPLHQAGAAQDYMRSNALFGKVVLTTSAPASGAMPA